MPKISAVIITYNEEQNIERCLKSIEGVVDEILVLDSFSNDNTERICNNYNVKFVQQDFLGYIEQKQYATQLAKFDHILALDADEALSPELRKSILNIKDNWTHDAYRFSRLNNYCGKWIYHTCLYPERKIRLFIRNKGKWGGINPHDQFIMNQGCKVGFLKGNLLHWLYESIDEHHEKIKKFSGISANEYRKKGIRSSFVKTVLRPNWRFFHSYFIKLGFLDGFLGFVISKNLAYQTFLKYSKLNLLKHQPNDNQIQLENEVSPGKFKEKKDINDSHNSPTLSVIITTYNQPAWLEKVLWGFENQTYTDFEIIIADDGSRVETKHIINQYINNSKLIIKHIWHEDLGYRKCTILNKAILASSAKYIIFTDGDCIPRNDFVETHLMYSERGYFLSGGAIRLPMDLSEKMTREDIISQKAFNSSWLYSNGLPRNIKSLKLIKSGIFSKFINFLTPARASWNGGNSSGWKDDFISVNGFNENMLYGGQDREFGERLINLGIKSKQIRFSAICLHLDHTRPYKTKESIDKNKVLRKVAKKTKIIRTLNGIEKTDTLKTKHHIKN